MSAAPGDDWEDMQNLIRRAPGCMRRELAYAFADHLAQEKGLDEAGRRNMYQVAELGLYLVECAPGSRIRRLA